MEVRTTWVRTLGVLLVALLLSACGSEPIGPSDNKVRLDLQDKLNVLAGGLASLDEFEVVDRDELSEDRVKFHIVMTFKSNQPAIDEFIVKQNNSARMFGTIGGPNMRLVKIAQQLDGVSEKATWVYQMNANGVWMQTQAFKGYR